MVRRLQTKLVQGIKIFLLAVLILSTFNSCKKDETENKLSDAQQIQKAKEWYQAQQKKQITKLAVAVGKESEMTFTPDWENAKVTYVNGVASISTDIKTNLHSKFNIERYFALVIKNDDDGFDYRILNIHSNGETKDSEVLNPIQLYQTAFTEVDLSAQRPINADIRVHGNKFKLQANIEYNNSGKTLLALRKPNTGIKVEAEQCYDAYMVTYVYENGILVDTYQEYLGFEICHPLQQYFDPEHPSSGSGGDLGPNIINITWGEADDTDGSHSLLSIDSAGNETHKINWTCYKINGNQLWFQSYDQVNIGRYGYSKYYWIAGVDHITITPTGGLDEGQSAELLLNTVTDRSTLDYAQIELSVKEKRTITQNNKTTVKTSAAVTARSRAWELSEFGH